MKNLKFSLFLSLLISINLSAQTKKISLEEIWNDTFKIEKMDVLHSMKNGKQYTVLKVKPIDSTTSVELFDYRTSEKLSTLVNSAEIEDLPSFSDYKFSDDESQLILAVNVKDIYRRSKKGHYYIYNLKSKDLTLIAKEQIQEPTFSPDGTKVAYGYMNNIYIKDLTTNITTQITFDGEKNKVINGIADWVYEEEFSLVRAFDWNINSDKLAFIKFDESDVPQYFMDIYGTNLYPKQEVIKYPKAGENNSSVSLHVYNLKTKNTSDVELNKSYRDFYIPRLNWTNDPDVLSAQYLNRHQNVLDIWMINTADNTAEIVLTETDEAYVEVTDNLTFLSDNSFIWTSEKDGYNHIYHYAKDGKLIDQVTKGKWEVTDFYGVDEDHKMVYYQSVENGSINRDVYVIKLNGRDKKRLSQATGTNKASFSADYSYFINTFSNVSTPTRYTLNSGKTGEVIRTIIHNHEVVDKLANYKTIQKEFSTISINGNDLNMWMMKPSNFDASKTYPLLMFQYSGPGSQKVANVWHVENDYWYMKLAAEGYIIACVDGRGTGFKGAAFKKVTQLQLGKYEVEDQIEVAKALGSRSYIDASRIGIWGWSYGGFMSSGALFKGNDVFKMAIAVAPVSSWRFYDSIYTERYMRTPQENPDGYDANSPLNFSELLKGDFLLIHGSADDNVHLQNTIRLSETLIQANKPFDMSIYPDKNHGIKGGNTRLHLYNKMTEFIYNTLGDNLKKEDSEEL